VTTSASARASDPLVAWLDDADIERGRIGGKAASLTRLASHGFRIPPGFCLTTDAFAMQAARLPGGERSGIHGLRPGGLSPRLSCASCTADRQRLRFNPPVAAKGSRGRTSHEWNTANFPSG